MKYQRIRLNVDYSAVGLEKTDENEAFLDAYLLDDSANAYRRKAVIVCPGGGYTGLAPHEGEPVAIRYLEGGMQSFVLHYSVAPATYPMALLELATSVKYLRKHADEMNIDPNGIYICGFSAGGHLCASLAVNWNQAFICEALQAKPEEIRPNGCILCYPRITYDNFDRLGRQVWLINGYPDENRSSFLEMISTDKHVTKDTPPTFLWTTWDDDSVDVSDSLRFIHALRENDVNCEFHIFRKGPHGQSLGDEEIGFQSENLEIFSGKRLDVSPWMALSIHWIYDLTGAEV